MDISNQRCSWVRGHKNEIEYHDKEWGVPTTDDAILFEYLLLDSFQAGLSWQIILNKREGFRNAFDDFDAYKISQYNALKIEELINNPTIIRNRLKIVSSITNAQLFLKLQIKHGSFANYIWQFTGHKTLTLRRVKGTEVPATSMESDAMSAALRKEGFKFVGSTICYAFMQASGMVNDHLISCCCYATVKKMAIKKWD